MQNNCSIEWLIFHTLGKLLARTSLDNLTTKELCEACHISRQTFYRYFHDKYEVITWHFDLLAENSLKMVGRTLYWRDAHIKLLCELHREKEIYQHAVSTNDYNAIKSYAYRCSYELYLDTLTNYLNIHPTDLLLFQINATSFVCSELTFNWAKNGMKEPPEKFADMLELVLPLNLKNTFEKGLPVAAKISGN